MRLPPRTDYRPLIWSIALTLQSSWGYHPLLAVAAGTGDVLMARLREGRANTARGAAHFLRETVGRVRYGGARGQLTVRAGSGFYTHAVAAVCRRMDVRLSITIRQHKSLHNLIEAIPEDDWTPIPYWVDGAADVAETNYRACLRSPRANERRNCSPSICLNTTTVYRKSGLH